MTGRVIRRTLWRHARLATLAGDQPWGWYERGALVSEGDQLAWVGDEAALPAGLAVDDEVDLQGAVVTPGFVDAHVHIESSMLVPSQFAKLAVVHGTIGTVSDPHEIANVLGVKGVNFMIENGKKVPFKFCFGAPSCVPATDFESAGAVIDAEEIEFGTASNAPWLLYSSIPSSKPNIVLGFYLVL